MTDEDLWEIHRLYSSGLGIDRIWDRLDHLSYNQVRSVIKGRNARARKLFGRLSNGKRVFSADGANGTCRTFAKPTTRYYQKRYAIQ